MLKEETIFRTLVMEEKLKNCKLCNELFVVTGKKHFYCKQCSSKKQRELVDSYRKKKGVLVGVGSGNAQGRGESHHTYKNGIQGYRDLARGNKPPFCERCQTSIDFSNWAKWCVHHKDHNRENNKLENLELLCKRCHQLEHNCQANLPKAVKV